MDYAAFLRQQHVARALGFRPLQFVKLRGAPGVECRRGIGVVYTVHRKCQTVEVALAEDEGSKGVVVPMSYVSHYNGAATIELINTLRSIEKLREQLGRWAPPLMGADD